MLFSLCICHFYSFCWMYLNSRQQTFSFSRFSSTSFILLKCGHILVSRVISFSRTFQKKFRNVSRACVGSSATERSNYFCCNFVVFKNFNFKIFFQFNKNFWCQIWAEMCGNCTGWFYCFFFARGSRFAFYVLLRFIQNKTFLLFVCRILFCFEFINVFTFLDLRISNFKFLSSLTLLYDVCFQASFIILDGYFSST